MSSKNNLIGFDESYYCNYQRPKDLRQHRINLNQIENRANKSSKSRCSSAKSSTSNKSNSSEKSINTINKKLIPNGSLGKNLWIF